MKRRAFKLLVFLLAGAIINVAVAWGLSIYEPHRATSNRGSRAYENHPYQSIYGECNVYIETWPGKTRVQVHRFTPWPDWRQGTNVRDLRQIVPKWTDWTLGDYQLDAPWIWGDRRNCVVVGSGWPCVALAGSFEIQSTTEARNESIGAIRSAVVLAAPMSRGLVAYRESPVIPLRPILAGFALNTIFYAAVAWMLFAAPVAIRRRRRIKRGQCAACGYSLRGSESEVCPECGVVRERLP